MTTDIHLFNHAHHDLCAITLLHRWGLKHPIGPELIEQKKPKFIDNIQHLIDALRSHMPKTKVTQGGSEIRYFEAKKELGEMIRDYNSQTNGKTAARKAA